MSVSTAAHSLGVVNILMVDSTRELFLRTAREHACEECALFLATMVGIGAQAELVPGVLPPPAVQEELKEVYRDFIHPGALYEIRIPTSLRRQLVGYFDPLTKNRRRKRSLWSISGKNGRKVFVSSLATLPERRDPVAQLEEGLSGNRSNTPTLVQPLTGGLGGINYGNAIVHLCEAMLIAEDLLRDKVSE